MKLQYVFAGNPHRPRATTRDGVSGVSGRGRKKKLGRRNRPSKMKGKGRARSRASTSGRFGRLKAASDKEAALKKLRKRRKRKASAKPPSTATQSISKGSTQMAKRKRAAKAKHKAKKVAKRRRRRAPKLVAPKRRRRQKAKAAAPKRRRRRKPMSTRRARKAYRKAKVRHARKRHAAPSNFLESANPKRKHARKSRRRRRHHMRRNPSVKAVASGMLKPVILAAVAGAAYPFYAYAVNKVFQTVDNATGNFISKNITGSIDATVPGLSAPTLALLGIVGVKMLVGDQDHGKEIAPGMKVGDVHALLDGLVILTGAQVGQALAAKLGATPAGLGLSGVKFFPGAPLGDADFGVYHQQPGDFGNVKYIPGPHYGNHPQMGVIPQGMSGVQYYPTGSDGDSMFTQGTKSDWKEAGGLGIIPEGLGDADFGIIPEGLSGDEGQLG